MSNFFDAVHSKPKELTFEGVDSTDISLCPSEFLQWLVRAREIGEDEAKGEYHRAVGNMCEYSCLWACGKLRERHLKGELKGELYVCYGKFGFWEHYWLGYKLDRVEYFLDLTLAQFRKESPKFSVLKGDEAQGVCEYNDFVRVPFAEFFGRLERDWELIESGKVVTFDDYMRAQKNSIDKLRSALNGLE